MIRRGPVLSKVDSVDREVRLIVRGIRRTALADDQEGVESDARGSSAAQLADRQTTWKSTPVSSAEERIVYLY